MGSVFVCVWGGLVGGGRCWVNFQFLGVLHVLIWIIVGQRTIALAVGAVGVVYTFFLSSFFFLALWETDLD